MGMHIRVGRICEVNREEGTVRVDIPDMEMVTEHLPLMVFAKTFYIPEIEEKVIILVPENGIEKGVVLGGIWGEMKPQEEGNTITQFNERDFIKYDEETNELVLHVHKLRIEADEISGLEKGEEETL